MRAVPPGPRSAWDAVRWWERRRIGYNALLAASDVLSAAVWALIAHVVRGSTFSVEQFTTMHVVILLSGNVAYTLGWISEVRFGSGATTAGRGTAHASRLNSGITAAMDFALVTTAVVVTLYTGWQVFAAT